MDEELGRLKSMRPKLLMGHRLEQPTLSLKQKKKMAVSAGAWQSQQWAPQNVCPNPRCSEKFYILMRGQGVISSWTLF